jgi:hypothetical protein
MSAVEQIEQASAVSTNERGELVLSLDRLRAKPRWIEVPDESGELVRVKIPGSLSLQQMMDFWAIEDELTADGMTDEKAIPILADLSVELGEIIARNNPGVEVTLDLDPRQAVALFGFLARPHDTLAALFVDALTGGGEKPDVADDARTIARAGGMEDALDAEEEGSAPLASERRSSSRSSRSGRSTAGSRSGGKPPAARGKASARTSRSRSATSASANDDSD